MSPRIKKPAARQAALSAALKALAGGRVRDEIAAMTLSHRERALAMRIAIGSVKHHLTLKNIYNAICRKKHLPENVQEIFRQAAYQILFTNVEPAVAIDAAVSLAKRTGPHVARIANGLLRKVVSLEPERKFGCPPFDDLRRSIFLAADEGGTGYLYFPRRLVRRDPKGDLEHASSLPGFLAWRYYKTLGEEAFWKLVDWANSAPWLTVRVNRLKVPDAEPPDSVLPQNAEPLDDDGLPPDVYLLPETPVSEVPGLKDGLLIAQDAANMLPVEAAGIEPGMNVLDVCAAPGGKTIQAAELMRSGGRLVAVELDPERLDMLKANLERLGAGNVEVAAADARALPPEFEAAFDRVIVDVPCTNTGQLARRPEVRLRVSEESVRRLAAEQKDILASALTALRPGGCLVYSTCSLEPEENGEVVRSLDGVEILEERLTWPQLHRHDGGYFALLKKGSGKS